jgi:hypothetical protein
MVAGFTTGVDSPGLAVASLPVVEIEAPWNGLILPLFDRGGRQTSPQSRVVLILDRGWLAKIELMLTVGRPIDLHA